MLFDCFPKGGIRGDHVLLLTQAQNNRLDKAQVEGRRAQIRMSATQVAKNVSYTRFFIGMMTSLAARSLPTILTGLTTDLLSGGISQAISGSGDVDRCYRAQKCKGDGLYLAPHPRFVEGDGLFLKHGNDGAGLLMGAKSPFENIPILGWLL